MLDSLLKSPKITIERFASNTHAVHSQISFRGRDICYAFENIKEMLPAGQYAAYLIKSSKFNKPILRFIAKGDIKRDIHPANYANQLSGGIAPILSMNLDGGIASISACNKLYDTIGKEAFYLIDIIDNFQTTH